MNARIMFVIAILIGFAAAMPNSQAYQAPEKLDDKVRLSIDKGIQYLRDMEKGKGNWELDAESNIRKGGWTSLAMLSLLNCGVPPEDEMMKRGLEYLRGVPPSQTYTVGLQTMVYCLARQPQDRDRIQRNVDWLKSAKLRWLELR